MTKKTKTQNKKETKVSNKINLNGIEDSTQRKLNFNTSWQYAPAPEKSDHFEIKKKYDLFINGKFVKPTSGKYFDSTNPANGQKIA